MIGGREREREREYWTEPFLSRLAELQVSQHLYHEARGMSLSFD